MNMMRMSRLLAILPTLGLTLALATPIPAAGKTHDVTGEVVSVDLAAKVITIKDETGENKKIPVLPSALESLKTVKVGDNVLLTCEDNEKGEHQGVSAIKPAPVAK
jgi:Cu/Ag efflux protein CusF